MIGRLLCHLGFHKWGKPYSTVRTSDIGLSLWGCHAQDCQRKGCTWRRWHDPS